jgi:hypothetical protein
MNIVYYVEVDYIFMPYRGHAEGCTVILEVVASHDL